MVDSDQQPNRPADVDFHLRPRVVPQRHALVEAHRGLVRNLPAAPIEGSRHLPMIEIERIATLEEERILAAFGPKPEPIFAAKDVHVRLSLTGGNGCTPDPPEARLFAAARRARHDTSLIRRAHGDPGSRRVGKQHHPPVLSEKGDVRFKASGARGRRRLICRLASGRGKAHGSEHR